MAFIESNINAEQCNDILWDNFHCNALNIEIPNSYYFQQVNDPKCTAYITSLWLLCNVKNELQMPSQSPDLNLTENLWHILDMKRNGKKNSNKSLRGNGYYIM